MAQLGNITIGLDEEARDFAAELKRFSDLFGKKKKKKDKGKWHKIEDGLPPAFLKYVIVRDTFGEMFVASRLDTTWVLRGDETTVINHVTHWHPLPDQPKDV